MTFILFIIVLHALVRAGIRLWLDVRTGGHLEERMEKATRDEKRATEGYVEITATSVLFVAGVLFFVFILLWTVVEGVRADLGSQ